MAYEQKPSVMAEDGASPKPAPDSSEGQEQSQTVEIPISAYGDTPPNPGDTIQMKVVSVDAEAGTMNCTVVMPSGDGGSDELAASGGFDKPEKM